MATSIHERRVNDGGGENQIEYPNFANAMKILCKDFQCVTNIELQFPAEQLDPTAFGRPGAIRGKDSTGNEYFATKIYEDHPAGDQHDPLLKEIWVFKGQREGSQVVRYVLDLTGRVVDQDFVTNRNIEKMTPSPYL